MIKLIASDMDGTLLNEKLVVSDENAEAIKKAQESGVHFLIATGRGYDSGYPLVQKQGITCPFIGQNGAVYYDETGDQKYSIGLNNDDSYEMMNIFEHYPVYYELMTDKGLYTDDMDKHINHLIDMLTDINPDIDEKDIEKRVNKYKDNPYVNYVDDLKQVIDDNSTQVLKFSVQSLSGPKKLIPLKAKLYRDIVGVEITASSRKNLEINHKFATKGKAVLKYAKDHGISPDEIMTLGDNVNDISMLTYAKYGVAMANGVEEVLNSTNFQTSKNSENGVAKAIYKALNNEFK